MGWYMKINQHYKRCEQCEFYEFVYHDTEVDIDLGSCNNMDIPISISKAYVIGATPCYCDHWKLRKSIKIDHVVM